MNNVNMTVLKDSFKPLLINTPSYSFFQLALATDIKYPNISIVLQNHDYQSLDSLYFFGRSGNKIISPLVENYVDANNTIQYNELLELCKIIRNNFYAKWNKIIGIWLIKYVINENTFITEHVDDKTTIEHTGTINNENTTTNDLTNNTTHGKAVESINSGGTTNTKDLSDDNSKSAFGTGNTIHNDTTAYTGTETLTNNLSNKTTNSGTDIVTNTGTVGNTNLETRNAKDETTTTHDYNKHGSIGVVTSQHMLEQEFALWLEHNFMDIMFADIDSILTASCY